MPDIIFAQKTCLLKQGDNLLEGLLQHGIKVPYSCRAGFCHSCLLQLIEGLPPDGSQAKLTCEQIKKRYILACQSVVLGNLRLQAVIRDEIPAKVSNIEKNDADVCASETFSSLPFHPAPE